MNISDFTNIKIDNSEVNSCCANTAVDSCKNDLLDAISNSIPPGTLCDGIDTSTTVASATSAYIGSIQQTSGANIGIGSSGTWTTSPYNSNTNYYSSPLDDLSSYIPVSLPFNLNEDIDSDTFTLETKEKHQDIFKLTDDYTWFTEENGTAFGLPGGPTYPNLGKYEIRDNFSHPCLILHSYDEFDVLVRFITNKDLTFVEIFTTKSMPSVYMAKKSFLLDQIKEVIKFKNA